MKTVFLTTDRFVRREGNVIDLCEYRDRLQRSGAVLREEAALPVPTFVTAETPRRAEVPRKRRRIGLADLAELCASVGALVLVLTVWLQLLL